LNAVHSQGVRAGRPPLGSGGPQNGDRARPQGQEGHPQHASDPGGRIARPAAAPARPEPKSPFVFTSERGAPFTTAGFARMVERAGSEAKLGFKAHPHMLRHACGYTLANAATTPGRFRLTSDIATSSIRCAIPSCHRCGSKFLGSIEAESRACRSGHGTPQPGRCNLRQLAEALSRGRRASAQRSNGIIHGVEVAVAASARRDSLRDVAPRP
jgi:Phage integrase family